MIAPGERVVGWAAYAAGQILAELGESGGWRVTVAGRDRPAAAEALAARYADHYRGPQDGYFGQRILADLAERTGGVAAYNPPPGPGSPPGTVY